MKTCAPMAMAAAVVAFLVNVASGQVAFEENTLPIPEVYGDHPLPAPSVPDDAGYQLPYLETVEPGYVESMGWYEPAAPADCPACCEPVCIPRWTVRAAAVAMQRTNPSHRYLFEDPFDPSLHFERADFEFDYELGVDFSLARRLDWRHDLQARYLRVDGWEALATGSTDPASGIVVKSDPELFFTPGRDIAGRYTSQFDTYELNLRRQFNDCLILLAGFRYADLRERFYADLVGPGPVLGTYDTATSNRLYGLQLGGEAKLWDRGGRLRIDNIVKAGVYGNDCAVHDTILDTGAQVYTASDRTGQVCFLGEAGLYAVIRLTRHLSVRGGYQVMWIEGLALATDQVAVTNFNDQNGIDARGGLFYHGAVLGLEFVH